MNRKKGEVIVMTGASAGIGRAAVEQFTQRGVHIALPPRDQAGLTDGALAGAGMLLWKRRR